jgi:hypothetical protein
MRGLCADSAIGETSIPSSQPCGESAASPRTVAAPDPCAAEQTTLAIESCVMEHVRRVENDIQAALTRFTGVLNARGIPDAAALAAASQSDWERYRGSQCQLFEKLSEVAASPASPSRTVVAISPRRASPICTRWSNRWSSRDRCPFRQAHQHARHPSQSFN